MRITDAIILAAGSSSRLGQPKQLVLHQGLSLLQSTVSKIQATGMIRETLVVLGAHHERIQPSLTETSSRIVIHTEWTDGMGSSLKKGLKALISAPPADQILVTVCDLPGVSTKLFADLITKHQTGRISASKYPDGRVGTPAVFCQSYFSKLCEVPPMEGARKFLHEHKNFVDPIPFELGYWDIDTPEDLSSLVP